VDSYPFAHGHCVRLIPNEVTLLAPPRVAARTPSCFSPCTRAAFSLLRAFLFYFKLHLHSPVRSSASRPSASARCVPHPLLCAVFIPQWCPRERNHVFLSEKSHWYYLSDRFVLNHSFNGNGECTVSPVADSSSLRPSFESSCVQFLISSFIFSQKTQNSSFLNAFFFLRQKHRGFPSVHFEQSFI
jgi:hypothetical protein